MPDLTIQHTEKMVGAGHPSLSDTLNRLALVEHNNDGTHKGTNIYADLITKGPWVDVRAYGAVGDGVTDDTTAIQNARTYARSLSPDAYLFFPKGTYKYSTSITDVSIIGDSKTSTILLYTGTGAAVSISSPNYTVDKVWIKPGASASSCLYLTSFSNGVIGDMILGYTSSTTNSAHGIHLYGAAGTGTYGATFGNVYATYLGGAGIFLETADASSLARVGSCHFLSIFSVFNAIGMKWRGTQSNSFGNVVLELNTTYGLTAEINTSSVANYANSIQMLYIGNNTTAEYSITSNAVINSYFHIFNTGAGSLPPATVSEANGNIVHRADASYLGKQVNIYNLTSIKATTTFYNSATSKAISFYDNTAGAESCYVRADGRIVWGADTNLYRLAANQLKTDDTFLANGGIGVGNSVAATTPGSVVKKMEVFSASGVSLGFVPIYDAIT